MVIIGFVNILIVTAHDDPKSFVAALHNTALGVLERAEHSVSVTDLYAQSFNPVAAKSDFETRSVGHVNYMFEQQRTVNTGEAFSPDIRAEMDKVSAADMIIIQFPLWWGGPPAILKGWFERVLAMGFAWGADNRYEKGLLHGKTALVVVAAGDPQAYYSADGMHKASVEQHLYGLLHGTLAFCGLNVLKPIIVANTTAASREDLDAAVIAYRDLLQSIDSYKSFIYRYD